MQTRKQVRKSIRLARNKLSKTQQVQASEQVTAQLCKHINIKQAKHIALYLANDGELNLMPFIQWCWQQNKKTYLPVIHPFSKNNLLFLQYQASTEMVINQYGIHEPKLNVNSICLFENLDVICTPLVAFDGTGARLGMGGGFYDRTLVNKLPHQLIMGVAHNCQQVKHLPSESWDIPLAEIITPSKHFICSS